MYYYVVEYWDNLDQESRTESGVISAENYSAAADKVEAVLAYVQLIP